MLYYTTGSPSVLSDIWDGILEDRRTHWNNNCIYERYLVRTFGSASRENVYSDMYGGKTYKLINLLFHSHSSHSFYHNCTPRKWDPLKSYCPGSLPKFISLIIYIVFLHFFSRKWWILTVNIRVAQGNSSYLMRLVNSFFLTFFSDGICSLCSLVFQVLNNTIKLSFMLQEERPDNSMIEKLCPIRRTWSHAPQQKATLEGTRTSA